MKIRVKIEPQEITAIDEFIRHHEESCEETMKVIDNLLGKITTAAFNKKQKILQELSEL